MSLKGIDTKAISMIDAQDPCVSIIMNCHNGGSYLREAIDSVYLQTYSNWEIIFWDNASVDNSAIIANSYNFKLKYYKSEIKTNLGEARVRAIKKAKGKYIAFLDADDYWEDGYLEEVCQLIEEYPHCVMYSTGYLIHLDTNSYGKHIAGMTSDRFIVDNYWFYRITNRWGLQASSTVVRSSSFVNYNNFFPYGVQHGEDSCVWDYFAAIGDIAHSCKILVNYSGNIDDQLTRVKRKRELPASLLCLHDKVISNKINKDMLEWVRLYQKITLIHYLVVHRVGMAGIADDMLNDLSKVYLNYYSSKLLLGKFSIGKRLFVLIVRLVTNPRILSKLNSSSVRNLMSFL